MSSSIFEKGNYNTLVGFGYVFSYLIIWLVTCQGVKMSGHLITYSARIPYFILILMIIRMSLLDGSVTGIE